MSEWRFEFEPRDMWVGVYWRWSQSRPYVRRLDVWLCIVPCLPLHLTWPEVHHG